MLQLNKVLGNKAVVTLLQHFAVHPTAEMSYSQLRREIGVSTATLAKALKILQMQGFIVYRSLGKMKLYHLEREHVFVKQFKILNTLAELLPAREIAKKFHCSIALFGSSARGEDTEKSDIDLLLLAEEYSTEIQSMLEKTIKSKRKITIHIFTNLEWSQMARKDPAFYERVEKDKIQIA